MKKGIVFYKNSRNIGDDIQSLAAYKILGGDAEIVDRESLNSYGGDKIKLLCNGWFMDNPTHWPPSDNIFPYFISFHVAKYSHVRKHLLAKDLVPYYQKHQPIGCRDHLTKRLFESIGVDSYYSGCLTLTLPESNKPRTDKIIITDLFVNDILKGDYAKKVALKLIPKKYHSRLEFVTHVREDRELSIDDKIQEAESLLDKYATAGLVVTSRIHCALPCLALGTPVVFFDFGYIRKRNRNRFEGILDIMHTVRPFIPFHENRRIDKLFKMLGIHRLFFYFIRTLKIDWENPQPNPTDHKEIADNIRKKVQFEFGLDR